jgi:hypothetical protein
MHIFGICPILHNYCVLENCMLIHIYVLDNIFVVRWMHLIVFYLFVPNNIIKF